MSQASRSKRVAAAIGVAALAGTTIATNVSALDMNNRHGGGMAAPHPAVVPHFAPPPPRFVAPPRVMSPPRVMAAPRMVSPARVVTMPHVAPTPHVATPRLVSATLPAQVRPSLGHGVHAHGSVTSLARLPLGHTESLGSVHAHHPVQGPSPTLHPTPASMPMPHCLKTGCGPVQVKIPGDHLVMPGHLKPAHVDPGVFTPGNHMPGPITQPPPGSLHLIGGGFNPPKLPILPLPKGTGGLTLKDPGFTQKNPSSLTPKDPGGLIPVVVPLIALPVPVAIPIDQPSPVLEPVLQVPAVAAVPVAVPVAVPAPTVVVAQPVATGAGALPAPVAAVAAPTCGIVGSDLSVAFQPAITAADIATFTKAYNVAMADGPNVDGVYRIRLLQQGLSQAQIAQVVASMQAQTAYVASATTQPPPALPTMRTACGTFVSVTFVPTIRSGDVTTFLKAYKVTMSDGSKPDGSYTIRLSDQAISPVTVDKIVDSMKGQPAFVSNVAKL